MINSLSLEALVQVLDALPVRLFWKDRDSRFLGCNQRFAEDAGVADPQELVGKSDYYFFHPDQAAAFRDDDADVVYTRQAKLGIVEKLTLANGQTRWLETNKLPLCNADGEVIGVLGMYIDITERKLAEDRRCSACLGAFAA